MVNYSALKIEVFVLVLFELLHDLLFLLEKTVALVEARQPRKPFLVKFVDFGLIILQ